MKFKPFMTHNQTMIVLFLVGTGLYVMIGADNFPRWIARYWPALSIGGSVWYVLRCAFPAHPKRSDHAVKQEQPDAESDRLK